VAIFDWFLKKQTEVMSLIKVILGRVELAGRDPASILLIDHELGHRHWTRIRSQQERGTRRGRENAWNDGPRFMGLA
jgi:hypothetical protein